MTPAEFKVVRESLGLTAQFLATRFSVSLRSIRNWEDGTRPIPAGVVEELLALEDFVESTADDAVEQLHGDEQTYAVPRTDADSPDDLPAGLYRAVGARVRASLPDATLDYL